MPSNGMSRRVADEKTTKTYVNVYENKYFWSPSEKYKDFHSFRNEKVHRNTLFPVDFPKSALVKK